MKRSEINNAIKWAEQLAVTHHITLPDFARYAPDPAIFADPKRVHLKKTMLGWDVSDFGSGDFSKVGAVLFTVRNGSVHEPEIGTPYAEKYIFLKEGNEQEIPLHYHIQKTEDIIGPYEVHDFYLYHFFKYGAGPEKLLFLAKRAFVDLPEAKLKDHLNTFLRRFFVARRTNSQ